MWMMFSVEGFRTTTAFPDCMRWLEQCQAATTLRRFTRIQPTASALLPSKVVGCIINRYKAMKRIKLMFPSVMTVFALLTLALAAQAQQPAPQQAASRFDVTNYRIEVQIIPDQHMLRAGADVTFVPQDATRSVVFELNGSLKVESIEMAGKPPVSYTHL